MHQPAGAFGIWNRGKVDNQVFNLDTASETNWVLVIEIAGTKRQGVNAGVTAWFQCAAAEPNMAIPFCTVIGAEADE